MSEQQQLTEGQKRVRLDFNPAGLKRVHSLKTILADGIDYLERAKNAILKNKGEASADEVGFVLREIATAQTSIQQASQMGVGALTTGLSFKALGDTKVNDAPDPIHSGPATKKPVTIDIITFDDFIQYGKENAGSTNSEGYPLSFSYKGHAISHETNTSYVIPTKEGSLMFTPDDVLITGVQGEIYPCKRDIFRATYTQ